MLDSAIIGVTQWEGSFNRNTREPSKVTEVGADLTAATAMARVIKEATVLEQPVVAKNGLLPNYKGRTTMVKKERRVDAYNIKVVLALLTAGMIFAMFLLTTAPSVSSTLTGNPTMISVCVFDQEGKLTGPLTMKKVVRTEEEWQKRLTPEQYHVTRNSGTERPFCGNLLDNKKQGAYTCVCCGLPLFASNAKFDSGTGWPSFFQPICKENVTEKSDGSHGMLRSEINCARCDAHLGHVFDDGPRDKTGLRFCLNSESLEFTEQASLAKLADPRAKK